MLGGLFLAVQELHWHSGTLKAPLYSKVACTEGWEDETTTCRITRK